MNLLVMLKIFYILKITCRLLVDFHQAPAFGKLRRIAEKFMPGKQKLRAAVIGAGGISQVSHIPNLLALPNVEVAAICDNDIGRAISVAKRFGVPAYYEDAEQMFSRLKVDFVLVATPTISHLPICQAAFENGVDVLVEKPLARSVEEARAIVESAERLQRILMVGMNHRFRVDTLHLKNALLDGKLGDIVQVRSGWLKRLGVWGKPYWFTDKIMSGGGVLLDLGLQLIDLILYLLDYRPIVEMNCSLSNLVLGLEVEDTAAAFLRFADGATMLLEVSWAHCSDEDTAHTIFSGSHGAAALNPLRITRRKGDWVVQERIDATTDERLLYKNSYFEEIKHFIARVEDRQVPLSSGREALSALDVVQRLYHAAGR